MYLALLALPFMTYCCISLFGRFIGARGTIVLSVFSSVINALLSMLIFYEVALCGCVCQITCAPYFHSELFDANWGFLFDTLSAVMCVVVTLIGCLVVIYSCSYMIADAHFVRFISYLKLFSVAMLILVTADNYVQLFVGWEGVGLASFVLISFWFTRLQASKSAIQAMLLNRVGDIGLALGVMTLFFSYKTTNYQAVFAAATLQPNQLSTLLTFATLFQECPITYLDLACILLFIGAMGKSGQFGLHAWLPNAMNAPTPVSALLHAATMVTAGIFLLARSSPLFEFAPTAALIVTIIGAITCIFAGTIGLVQNDFKSIIAYSTCSQLGYMVTICGLSNYNVGIFHLFNHAFFKALLFLTAGVVIHALANEQDIRKFGGLQQILIFSYTALAVGSLALIGTPFLTGFYSKDVILELAYARYGLGAHFSYLLTCFSVLTTSYYSFRLLFFCFNTPIDLQGTLKVTNLHKQSAKHAHDGSWVMCLVLAILAIGSIYAGYMFKPMFIGLGTDFWNNALTVKPGHVFMIEAEFLPNHVKLLPLWLTIGGAVLAYVFTGLWVHRSYNYAVGYVRVLIVFLNQRWFYDKLLNHYVGYTCINFGFELLKVFDKGLLELMPFFGLGLPKSLKTLYVKLGATQSGIIYHYATIMILAAFCALALLSFTNHVLFIDSRVLTLMLTCLIMF